MDQNNTIYHFDSNTREFLKSGQARLDPIEHKPLVPQYATVIEPPSTNENQVAVFEESSGRWNVQDDYRGYMGYDASGQKHEIKEIGVLPDKTWTTERPFIFLEAMTKKQAEIIQKFKGAMLAITGIYTDEDIASFPTQEAEAKAYQADSNSPAPFIDGLLANRPTVDKATLVQRILDNANTYKAVAGPAIGKKQYYEDLLYALKTQHEDPQQPDVTKADIDAIVVDYA